MVDWKVIKLNYENINELFDWRKLIGRREKNFDYIVWEYLCAPLGSAETLLAVYNGEIIGQYSAQRYDAFFFGEKIIGSLAFDAGTHPDYRRQGIFVALGKLLFSEEGKQNIPFSTGFPNESAVPGHKKVGWNFLCPLPLYECSKVKGIHKNNKYNVEYISEFDDDFKGFSERFQDDIPIYLNRTKRYLNWRYVDKPYDYTINKIYDKSGEMVSYIVTKKYQKTLHLVDFLIPENEDLYNDILYTLECLRMFLMLNKISLYVNHTHPFCKFLKNHGFEFKDTGRVYIVRKNNDHLDSRIFEENNHYITMGDCDVF